MLYLKLHYYVILYYTMLHYTVAGLHHHSSSSSISKTAGHSSTILQPLPLTPQLLPHDLANLTNINNASTKHISRTSTPLLPSSSTILHQVSSSPLVIYHQPLKYLLRLHYLTPGVYYLLFLYLGKTLSLPHLSLPNTTFYSNITLAA